ncbi:TetR/AcrR family transcriptional regulator [Catellatospora sichuanensis]|uniref:TetR/AcrR family transcriptional regulator n=1 Tax=Catellatospora sichuanensis TaxID=1969805 RepID=UPI001C9227FE|nr:TetR/AcrR family transcriptional regulator [Catellatospora sichuanensis]
MVRDKGSSRERMINSAVKLLATRGAAGTTIDGVLADSGAPRGSVYHHFPGGREELITAAARAAGERMSAFLRHDDGLVHPRQALAALAEFYGSLLIAGDYRSGCPIVALTVGGDQIPAAAEIAREVFTGWQEQYRDLLITHGVPPQRAATLATLTVAAVEGAVILARAQRSTAPLDDVVAELTALL